MTLLIYYTILYYHNAPLWLWLAGAIVWVLHGTWHHWTSAQGLFQRIQRMRGMGK